jgi:hypothetical protein
MKIQKWSKEHKELISDTIDSFRIYRKKDSSDFEIINSVSNTEQSIIDKEAKVIIVSYLLGECDHCKYYEFCFKCPLFKKGHCYRAFSPLNDTLFWKLVRAIQFGKPWKRLYNQMAKAVKDNPIPKDE